MKRDSRSEGRNCRLLNHEYLICMPRNFARSLLFPKFLGQILQEQGFDWVWKQTSGERKIFLDAYFKIFFNMRFQYSLINLITLWLRFIAQTWKMLYVRYGVCFLLFCFRTLLDTAYNVAGIWTFVIRSESVVSQNALYFFFSSSMRGVCGFICNTNSSDRSGFLQNSGMPFTRKVSRFLAYSEYLVYLGLVQSKKKKRSITLMKSW